MTSDNGRAPGQVPLPPPEKKPTGNRRNGWLYVVLGVLFLIIGGLGLVAGDADLMDWLFLVLGIANATMGIVALTRADPKIDPFAPKG